MVTRIIKNKHNQRIVQQSNPIRKSLTARYTTLQKLLLASEPLQQDSEELQEFLAVRKELQSMSGRDTDHKHNLRVEALANTNTINVEE